MPIYEALVKVRLDRHDQESARKAAEKIAELINEGYVVAQADVLKIEPETGESGRGCSNDFGPRGAKVSW